MTAMMARTSGVESLGDVRGGRVIVGIDDSPGGLAALRPAGSRVR
jgi:hypothetical protein